jgi:hypothetical protein
MRLKKFVPLALIALSLFSTVRSQSPNSAALRAFSLRSEARNQEMNARLLRLAKLKGWPLSISLKNGKRAYLFGLGIKGLPYYVSTNDNIISAATIGTTQVWPGGSAGLGLNGSTAALKSKIAIWDEGRVLATHQELTGRVLQKDHPLALSDHSTHVTGTMIATGVNPVAKGMSFAAQQLLAYDFADNSDVPEMSNAADSLLISNHSYGLTAGWVPDNSGNWTWYGYPGDTVDYKFGYYDSYCQAFDTIAYNAPDYLIVAATGNSRGYNGPAVGQPYSGYDSNFNIVPKGKRPANISSNDGYDGIAPPAGAKNILAIGAVNPIPGGYSSPSDVVLAYFSSWGPTDDGRIKPDMVADGVGVLSSISSSTNGYAIMDGTSMASPAAAGSAFLLQEYYYKLHNHFMRSATLKALLYHTTDEAGTSPGPDYQFGYGLIDIPNAAAVITSNNTDKLIQENALTGAAGSFTLPVVASGKGPLMATICWTDPAGSVDTINYLNNPAPKLVNDLDLRVTGNGNTYMPWILNPLIPANPATTGDDKINNEEKVYIPNAVPGKTYIISVTHKGSLTNGSQNYSLVVSGVGNSGYCASSATNAAGTRIDQVNVSNVSVTNPAGCTTYTDNTSHTINLQSKQSMPFTISLSSCDATAASRVVKIFIDYNNNGTFTDSGETVAVSPVLPGGTTSYSGTINVPAGVTVGNSTLLRIVAEETTDTSLVKPCGSYPNGETDDFSVAFGQVSNDIGVSQVVDPLPGTCQTDSQRVSIRIRNSGTTQQINVPIQLKVLSGNNTLVNITTVYPDTVAALGSAIYTFQTPFPLNAGSTYIIQATTLLPTDQNPANDGISDTVVISAGSEKVTAEAEICTTDPPLAGLKANTADATDAASWFDSPTSATAIATGTKANTTDIPPNSTYYMGLNEITGSVGPKSKSVFPGGGYNNFLGNFSFIHNDVPLTINSARLYIGAPGKLDIIVGDLASYDSCTGAFSWYTVSENVIDVYATTPNISRVASSVNSPLDTGAVFLLNLAIPTPGNHILILVAEDSAFIYRSNNIASNPYPMGMPGIFTITGNSAINTTNCKDTAFDQKYYYFFYDMKITLDKCASPRVKVVAKTAAPVVVTRVANNLISNYASGNTWYYNDTLIVGTDQTLALSSPGNYKDVVNDSVGCELVSAEYLYTPGNDIGLSLLPNPNHGQFTVQFYQKDVASPNFRITDINGRLMYQSFNPGFHGSFSRTINLGQVATGTYIMQLQIGSKNYVQKFVIVPND